MTYLTTNTATRQGNVLYHPHFDRPKVIQPKRKGRYPKAIISLWKVRLDKNIARRRAEQEAATAAVASPDNPGARWHARSEWGRIEQIRSYISGLTDLGVNELLPVASKVVEEVNALMRANQKSISS